MPHQDTPPGIHVSHPPIQPNKAVVNAYRDKCSATSLGMLLDGLIEELPNIAGFKVQQRIVEKLRFAIAISGYSNDWKKERTEYLIEAVKQMQATFLLSVTITSHQQPDGSQQGRVNVLGKHMEGDSL